MQHDNLIYVAAAGLMAVWFVTPPATTHAAKTRNLSINVDGNAEHCSDLKVKSDGEVAQAAESFSMRRNEVSILELQDTAGRSVVRVRGWDRAEYAVEACKIAAADNRGAAEALVRGITVGRIAGRFSTGGPAGDNNGNWQLYFIIHAPKDGQLDIETKNGPIDVEGISGNLKLRASNGPIALKDCSGQVEVHTVNGPIAFSGGGGDVHLNAHNGPIALQLAGEFWNGSKLDARTMNGPVSVEMAETFRSGVRVETDGNSPISCVAGPCRTAFSDRGGNQRTLQMNGAQDTIRVSTNHGPVSVSTPKKSRRII